MVGIVFMTSGSYDAMLVVMNLVIVTTGGGNLSLTKWFE